MAHQNELIPHLFRTEFGKITAVLCRSFGFHSMELAEDIAGETFLLACETWPYKGVPPNPTAWLYTVAKNKAINTLQREKTFNRKIIPQLSAAEMIETIDLSEKNISDSVLQMMFAVCQDIISPESQITLALRILCGFGINEIADAFHTQPATIHKRLLRAKNKLKTEQVRWVMPGEPDIKNRLQNVLTTLYLLFSEGYYSAGRQQIVRKELCDEAIRLTTLLTENNSTADPGVFALLALMYFQSSRLEARISAAGELILLDDQDRALWDVTRIASGAYWLHRASVGTVISQYHLEAAIAYQHTLSNDHGDKWKTLLHLYDQLIQLNPSPQALLSRIFVISKSDGKQRAIAELEKLKVEKDHFYYALLGELYAGTDRHLAKKSWTQAMELSDSPAEKQLLLKKISLLE